MEEQQQQKKTQNPDSEILCFLHYMKIQNKIVTMKDILITINIHDLNIPSWLLSGVF